MNKKTFLEELKKNLAVLQEDELKDIISEYEQHIDMKIQSGLSEEEATADFGSLEELTAEILEAYHVRSDYATSSQKSQDNTGKPNTSRLAASFHRIRDRLKLAALTVLKLIKNLLLWIRSAIIWLIRQIARPFLRLKNIWDKRQGKYSHRHNLYQAQSDACCDDLNQDGISTTKGMRESSPDGQAHAPNAESPDPVRRYKGRDPIGGIKGIWRRLINIMRTCILWFLKATAWCMLAIWNASCAVCALVAAFCGLICLFGFGILAVLLTGGYPLAGVTLGCFGLALCTFSAAIFGLTLIKHRKGSRHT